MKKPLAATVLTLTAAGLLSLPAPAAQADDDAVKRSGSCSQGAAYTVRLRDAGDDPDRLRVSFFLNSDKAGRTWSVKVKRGDRSVGTSRKSTKPNGNLTTVRTFRGDEDTRVTVFARSGYGETCRRVLSLDRDGRDD